MTTTMVTARMDEAKKLRCNAILKKNGKTPSVVINELYDYIIKENSLPWKKQDTGIKTMQDEKIADAKEFLRSIQVDDSQFSTMSDEDIKRERLMARSLI